MKDRNIKYLPSRKHLVILPHSFILLCILSIINEVFDIPNFILGASLTPVNWKEIIIEILFIFFVWLIAVYILRKVESSRKQAEDALRETEERFRTIFESAKDSIFIKDSTLKYTQVNTTMEKLFGIPSSKLIGITDDELFEKDAALHIREIDSRVLKGEFIEEEHTKTVKGVPFTFHIIKVPIYNKSGEIVGLCGIAHDITERKKSEEQVKIQKAYFEELFESSPEAIAILDNNDRILQVNKEFCNLFEYTEDEVKGSLINDLVVPPDLAEEGSKATKKVLSGEFVYQEAIRQTKYGKKLNVIVIGKPIILEKDRLAIYAIYHDITERKRADEALKQKTNELMERNEELDSFAHTVAHDLKNPLGIIIGFSDLLNENYSGLSEDEIRNYIHIIAQDGNKMLHIIDELLLLSSLRKEEIKPYKLNMSEIVAEAISRLSQIIEENNAEIILPEKWHIALGYTPWLIEVWVNFINNAIKYGGKPPKIELGVDMGKTKNIPEGSVRFWIRDNGQGISAENQKRLFEKYERLDQIKVEGYGLGLSIVRRIIEKLGGQAGVESEIGKGSVFYFTLPADGH